MTELMRHALLVFLGSGLGGVARFGVSELMKPSAAHAATNFPWPTFVVNLLGCFVIGVVAPILRGELAAFVLTGVLGGFTTFSSFSRETIELWNAGRHGVACVYVIAGVSSGIGSAALGYWLSSVMKSG